MIQYVMFVHGCVFLKCYVIGISIGSAAHIQLQKVVWAAARMTI